MTTSNTRRASDINVYTVFLALSGVFSLAWMVSHLHIPRWSDFLVVLSMTIGLSFFPIRMVKGFKQANGYSTSTIGYLYLLQYMGLSACLVGMALEVLIMCLRDYGWQLRRVRWFLFFASMGVYLYSALAVQSFLVLLPSDSQWVRSFFMFLIFDMFNQFFLLSIQRAIGHRFTVQSYLGVWRDMLVPLFVCSTILATVLEPSSTLDLFLRCVYASMMMAGIIYLNARQVRAAEGFRTIAAKYEAITQNTQDCILLIDHQFVIRYASPSHRHLLNRAPTELEDSSFFQIVRPEDQSELEQALESVKLTGNAVTLATHFSHLDGFPVPIELKVAGVRNEEGAIKSLVIIARDQTDRLKTEALLRKSERLAVVGQLAAGVAHEVRNPLTSIKGFIQILETSPADLPRFSPIILSELEHIESIIKEFLVWSKPEFGRREHHDIAQLMQTVVSVMSTQAVMNGVVIETTFEKNLPTVWCDEVHIKQVLVNVVKNAIESMQNGGQLVIHVYSKAGTVHVDVTDEGIGIPPHLLSKVGDPFFTTKQDGTGLGMMVTFKIIGDHGGRIQLSSDGHHGTTVRIELPASPSNPVPNL